MLPYLLNTLSSEIWTRMFILIILYRKQNSFPSGQWPSSPCKGSIVTVAPAHPSARTACTRLCGHCLRTLPPHDTAPSCGVGPGLFPSFFLKKCFQKWNENKNQEVLWAVKRVSYEGNFGQRKTYFKTGLLWRRAYMKNGTFVCLYVYGYGIRTNTSYAVSLE